MNDQRSVRTVEVHFEGAGEGVAPLTWAQEDHWHIVRNTGAAPTIGGSFQMPAGTTVDEIAELLRFILSRHQSLRTRMLIGPDGQAQQACSACGEITLTVIEVGSGDPAQAADEIRDQWTRQLFDYQRDWPVRMAVVTVDGAVSHVVTVYLHLAIDAGGISALMADLSARDPITGEPAGPVTAMQPMELAGKQAKLAAQRQSAASLRHLEQVLRTAPAKLFGEPRSDQHDYRKLRYRSSAIDLAASRVAAERGASPSTVLLAAFTVALARHLRTGTVWTAVLVNNRFRPGCADSVSHLVQGSPCLVELAGRTVGDALALTQASLLNTYKTAYYDGRQRRALERRLVEERGEPVPVGCCYNDRGDERPAREDGLTAVASDRQLSEAMAASSWTEEFEHGLPTEPLFLNLDYAPDGIELVASFDTSYFELAEAVSLLRLVEQAAVDLALAPDSAVLVEDRVGTPA